MAKKGSWNPFAFLHTQVTVIGSVIYAASLVALLVTHLTVPPAPTTPTPVDGVNLTEAWQDLTYLTDGFHPLGSRRNEEVKAYLLARIGSILRANGVEYETAYATGHGFVSDTHAAQLVTVFANDTSNITALDDWGLRPVTQYSESENILVYLRGTDDKEGKWWNDTAKYDGSSGVLINAHYDSVASGYGATDDGVGVVSVLQIISHFSRKGNQPKRGIVALLNNDEENGLNGARNYVRHPLSRFPHTFLNLEGAGAGGRAMLFRSTDAEITRAYAKSPRPFGSVITADGFKRGFVRSGTDYTVFTQELGLRGLDVAFFEPRARYHTVNDDARDTSPDSVWHMLSAALATVNELTAHRGSDFEGGADRDGKLATGSGSGAVYFDVFGRALAVVKLHDLFALSVSLLVAAPVLFLILQLLLQRSEKWYPFAGRKYLHSADDDNAVRMHGRRGFFRFLVAFVLATAAVLALAYLQALLNPYIIYSSQYAVWAMLLSAFFTVAWFVLAGSAYTRPTALHRMYGLLWLYIFSWLALTFATVGENNFAMGSGYFVVIFNASVFVALLISYLELFALAKQSKYVEHVLGVQTDVLSSRRGSISSRRVADETEDPLHNTEEAEASERTSLLRGGNKRNNNTFTGFMRSNRVDLIEGVPEETDDPYLNRAYHDEQPWSARLPQWTWIIQFLVLVPINTIVIGQIALILTSSLHQTPADGNAALPIYFFLAILAALLVLPLTPFLHRFTRLVPSLLFLVLLGCLAYNLLAFPFTRDAKMHFFFLQEMNLDTGANNVSLTGLDGYLQSIVGELPSAQGKEVTCGGAELSTRHGLKACKWPGIHPNVVPSESHVETAAKNATKKISFHDWIDHNITNTADGAHFSLRALNTKMCRIVFDNRVSRVEVKDTAPDPRQPPVPEGGSQMIYLSSRTWDKTFHVDVGWDGEQAAKGQKGRIVCMWSDANQPGVVPAWDEALRFAPVWSIATKAGPGLLEGWKEFEV